MKKLVWVLGIVSLQVLGGCASQPEKPVLNSPPPMVSAPLEINSSKLDKTIENIKADIAELQKLEEEVYAKSLKGNVLLKRKLDEKITRLGSVETLQANLRVLEELKSQNKNP